MSTEQNSTYCTDMWHDLVYKTLDIAMFEGLTQESFMQAVSESDVPYLQAKERIQNVRVDIPRLWWDMLDMDIYKHAKTVCPDARIRDKIFALVSYRILTQMGAYKPVVREIFSHFALPHNAGFAMHHMWESAGHMWVAIGDTTPMQDHNYYTKRLILSGVLFTSIAYWLQDDAFATHDYIHRRIEDALRLGSIKDMSSLARFSEYLPFMDHPLKMRD